MVMDCALTPVQQRNLEKAWGAKVIDRTGPDPRDLRAPRPHPEGTLQVELAHLSYQKSRLVRSWTHLERQRGGFGFLGGPGETQIEADRRLIQERMTRIERDLETVVQTRALHRAKPPAGAVSDRGPRRLHQCRQVDPVQPHDRQAEVWPRTCCSRRSTRPRAPSSCRTARRPSCPTRSASSRTCRPCWWRPSGRPSRT